MAHGSNPAQAEQDEEGMEVMRTMGRNMAWLLNCIALGKHSGIAFPIGENPHHRTDFIK